MPAQTDRMPKLRFPEFLNEPGWAPRRLGLALTFQPGFPFPSSGFNSVGEGLRLVRNRDLRSDDSVIHFSDNYRTEFVVGDDDVLIGMDGDFTPCIWTKGKALLNQRVGRILPKYGYDQGFLFHLLTLSLKAIEEVTARTTVKHLSHSQVENMDAPVPSKREQIRIAECLSTLDELIGAESQKLEALKAHKHGLMQQLFPREGEALPDRRFPNFHGHWKPNRLDSLCEGIYSGSDKSDAAGEFDLYGSTGVIGKTAVPSHSGRHILIARVGANAGLLNKVDGQFGVTDNTLVIRPKSSISVDFVFHYLRRVKLNRLIFGSGQPLITGSILKELPVLLPIESEQLKISDCLSALDSLIASKGGMIELLTMHKKGLMQQLFPSAGELT